MTQRHDRGVGGIIGFLSSCGWVPSAVTGAREFSVTFSDTDANLEKDFC
jgi:hypothetical protein